jgi:two-component system, sporulation sensor kinase E
MSIRKKVVLWLFVSLTFVLLINTAFIYTRARSNLRDLHESQLLLMTNQAAVTLAQSQNSTDYAEKEIAKQLKRAAQTAAQELNPEREQITVEQLSDLSRRTGVSGFSLLYKKDNQLVTGLSTDPQRFGKSVDQPAVSRDQPLENTNQLQMTEPYWLDSSMDRFGQYMATERAGYYYDGKRNYMIHVFLRLDDLDRQISQIGWRFVINEMKANDSNLLEVTGFRWSAGNGASPVLFGSYEFTDASLGRDIQSAVSSGKGQIMDLFWNKNHYIQSVVPVHPLKGEPFVLRLVYSYEPLSSSIQRQLWTHGLNLLTILCVMLLLTYILVRLFIRPLRLILVKVKDMADGRFETRLQMVNRDELGVLAKHINRMADRLSEYTSKLQKMRDENHSMREYLESVINQMTDAIHLSDRQGNVIRINKAFEELYGWTEEELIGRRLPFLPSYNWTEWEQREASIKDGEPVHSIETIRLRKDGSEVEVSISESPIYDKNKEIIAYITISRDMSEHNQMQELLRRSEKLTTVGQLAAGVAHEIRNPLTTLRGFLQLQQQTQTLNLQHVDIMLSELDRINLIVSEFLILAKPQANIFQNKDIRFVLGDVISLLDSQAHLHNIEFVSDFAKESIVVYCEENQLKQVFINILKNAMEAMPNGGGIGIKIIKENNQALIGIIDEGVGIPLDKIAKLGEPFYTSKEKGTGLGLMVSQRIIEAHKGTMNINSMVGWGTMVTITLPLVSALEQEPDASANQED